MTKPCRKVLKNLRKLSSGTEDILVFFSDTYCIGRYHNTDSMYDYSKYKGEICSVINQLVSDGYLEYSINRWHFTLTQKGLHPHQFQWDAFKSFLFRSVLVPVGVSFVTTLLTLLVQELLVGK